MNTITPEQIRQAFETAIKGDLADNSFTETYTESVSFSVREMREIMALLGVPVEARDPDEFILPEGEPEFVDRETEGLTREEIHEWLPPKDEDLTCFRCEFKSECKYAWDPYNTNGDCLALK